MCETEEARQVRLSCLRPAAWNANRVPAGTLAKLRSSIERFGVVENLVARPHPDEPGALEVLSGNHRLTLLRELGYETAPVVVVELDDAQARLLAQTLNRTRGEDDPEAYARLLETVLADVGVGEITALLPESPESIDRVLARLEPLPPLLSLRKNGGYDGELDSGKLGYRLEAVARCRRRRSALELFAGRGQLSYWYRRLFGRVVTVDCDPACGTDYVMEAGAYLRQRFLADGPFDLVCMDDEGCPWRELDALFEVVSGRRLPEFVLAVTDGYAFSARVHGAANLERQYRWPSRRARADRRVMERLPELLAHGVGVRAREAGWRAELIAVEWKTGRRVVFGSWVVSPRRISRK